MRIVILKHCTVHLLFTFGLQFTSFAISNNLMSNTNHWKAPFSKYNTCSNTFYFLTTISLTIKNIRNALCLLVTTLHLKHYTAQATFIFVILFNSFFCNQATVIMFWTAFSTFNIEWNSMHVYLFFKRLCNFSVILTLMQTIPFDSFCENQFSAIISWVYFVVSYQ